MNLELVKIKEDFYSEFDKFITLTEPTYLYLLKLNDKTIGYANISKENNKEKNMLYLYIIEQYRGNGYGSKLVSQVNNWLFNNMGVDYIIAQVDVSNIHSNNTLFKAGM